MEKLPSIATLLDSRICSLMKARASGVSPAASISSRSCLSKSWAMSASSNSVKCGPCCEHSKSSLPSAGTAAAKNGLNNV